MHYFIYIYLFTLIIHDEIDILLNFIIFISKINYCNLIKEFSVKIDFVNYFMISFLHNIIHFFRYNNISWDYK